MNKKILIGSIIAVVILVLVSFTGVVGYQTTKSTIARASPLFSVRSSRAIDEESRDLTCDYIGKGEEITIPLLKRDNKTFLLQQIIDRISKMDDKENHKIINALRNLNIDIDDLKKFVVIHDDTINLPCTVICTWEYYYFCYTMLLFNIITALIFAPFFLVATLLDRGLCDFWSLACLITWECDI